MKILNKTLAITLLLGLCGTSQAFAADPLDPVHIANNAYHQEFYRQQHLKDVRNLRIAKAMKLFRANLAVLIATAYADMAADNPFFQNTTTRQKGCQIDFLIQTKFKALYVFEIRFSVYYPNPLRNP